MKRGRRGADEPNVERVYQHVHRRRAEVLADARLEPRTLRLPDGSETTVMVTVLPTLPGESAGGLLPRGLDVEPEHNTSWRLNPRRRVKTRKARPNDV